MTNDSKGQDDQRQLTLDAMLAESPADKPAKPRRQRKAKASVAAEAPPAAASPSPPASEPKVLTVSDLTRLIREAIEARVPSTVTVVGEISNFSKPGSGHLYFTLKDEHAQIRCAMWRSSAMRLKFQPADGLAVVATGRVEVYGPRGQYQLLLEKLQPSGMGALELAFRQLREKLTNEGLFDDEHKKSIPAYPFSIAVVTSPTGAAVRDILRTLSRRWPVGRVMIYPVQVQGEGSAQQIVEALDALNAQAAVLGGIDVIILARGGGSLEDLWSFNEEPVARAVFRSRIPVVVGVGHEVDVTIADLVADLRAATPTAAAECVAPVLAEVREGLSTAWVRLMRLAREDLAGARERIDGLARRGMFAHPIVLLGRFAQELDELCNLISRHTARRTHAVRTELAGYEIALNRVRPDVLLHRGQGELGRLGQRLDHAARNLLRQRREMVERQELLLEAYGPGKLLPRRRRELSEVHARLRLSLSRSQEGCRQRFDHLEARLNSCDYRQVLRRGFSVTRDADGRIVGSVGQVAEGQTMTTELKDGTIASRIEEVSRRDAGRTDNGGTDDR